MDFWGETGKEKEWFNCIQAAISYFCTEKDEKPQYLFCNCFGMEYKRKQGTTIISERMKPYKTMDFKECYEKVYGIHFKKIAISRDNFGEVMSKLTKESYVLIGFDAYYCTWNLAYGKTHFYHFCLVKSVNIEKHTVTCIDPYLKKDEVEWSIELLIAGYREGYLLKVGEHNETVHWETIKQILLHNLSQADIYSQYDMLIEDLLNIKSKDELFEVDDPNVCRVIIFSKQISKNYKGLLLMLKDIWSRGKGQEEKICINLIDKLHSQAILWDKISLLFIKIMIASRLDTKMIERLVGLLNEAKHVDIDIFVGINSIICDK